MRSIAVVDVGIWWNFCSDIKTIEEPVILETCNVLTCVGPGVGWGGQLSEVEDAGRNGRGSPAQL